MKQSLRICFGGLVLFMSVGMANAEITSNGSAIKNDGFGPYFIYPSFTFNGNTQIYLEQGDNDGHLNNIAIYDDEFSYVKSINIPQRPVITARYTYQSAIKGPIDISVENYGYEDGPCVPSIEAASNYLGSNWERETIIGEIRFFNIDPSNGSYFASEFYGKQYPSEYYWLRDNGTNDEEKYTIVRVTVYYKYGGYGFVGFDEPKEYTQTIYPEFINLEIKTDTSSDLDYEGVTQTLFNSDEAYEFIMPQYSIIDYNVETPEYKEYGQRIEQTGFQVVSDNGSTIATVNYPSGLYGVDSHHLNLYITSACKLLVAKLRDDKLNDYIVTYKVDSQNSVIRQLGSPVKTGMKVDPTATTRGSLVNVSIAPAEKGTRLSVIGTNGQKVLQRVLDEGTTSTQIETGHYSAGIYVVVLEDNKGTKENCKIIIR